jgi:hypothetical protein
MMYVEHWCEEHFNGLMLGSPDFSHLEVVSFVGFCVVSINNVPQTSKIILSFLSQLWYHL